MVPTRLTVWLLVLGLVLWLAGCLAYLPGVSSPDEKVRAVQLLVAAFDTAVLLLMLADAILAARSSRSGRLVVRRERPARLSLGIDNEVALVLENRGHLPLRM